MAGGELHSAAGRSNMLQNALGEAVMNDGIAECWKGNV